MRVGATVAPTAWAGGLGCGLAVETLVGDAAGAWVAGARTVTVANGAAVEVAGGIVGAADPPHAASRAAAVSACRTFSFLNKTESVSVIGTKARDDFGR